MTRRRPVYVVERAELGPWGTHYWRVIGPGLVRLYGFQDEARSFDMALSVALMYADRFCGEVWT